MHVRNLVKDFTVRSGLRRGTLRAVDDVSFTLSAGRTLGLVGESGSGKSTVARLIARLDRPTSGTISISADHPDRSYRDLVQMVFQDPFASLNPMHTVGHHLARPLLLHGRAQRGRDVQQKVAELLERVSLRPAAEFARRRPHELSGTPGMPVNRRLLTLHSMQTMYSWFHLETSSDSNDTHSVSSVLVRRMFAASLKSLHYVSFRIYHSVSQL
ncbi:ATP-binding cassette domain-containing protein [Kutzneria sp. 744]|uniref:ATP-binding cassette domain-containing protein n=1 Tax=Kutzneria sp. (strain 744) TaxID=345341 RepID=UPI0003EEDB03|nr:ATP-binding cassette domain-containing protein [Kutzneria sp. 744]EWM10106.1 peptide/nickel transporter ATP-binding protein [Kutzneria sp. 744]